MTFIGYKGEVFKITAYYEKTTTYWNNKEVVNKHRITIRTNGSRVSFNHYCVERTLSEQDLRIALWEFTNDALAYRNAEDLRDIAKEFGYSVFDGRTKKAWDMCKGKSEKWKKLTNVDLEKFSDWLRDKYNL